MALKKSGFSKSNLKVHYKSQDANVRIMTRETDVFGAYDGKLSLMTRKYYVIRKTVPYLWSGSSKVSVTNIFQPGSTNIQLKRKTFGDFSEATLREFVGEVPGCSACRGVTGKPWSPT